MSTSTPFCQPSGPQFYGQENLSLAQTQTSIASENGRYKANGAPNKSHSPCFLNL